MYFSCDVWSISIILTGECHPIYNYAIVVRFESREELIPCLSSHYLECFAKKKCFLGWSLTHVARCRNCKRVFWCFGSSRVEPLPGSSGQRQPAVYGSWKRGASERFWKENFLVQTVFWENDRWRCGDYSEILISLPEIRRSKTCPQKKVSPVTRTFQKSPWCKWKSDLLRIFCEERLLRKNVFLIHVYQTQEVVICGCNFRKVGAKDWRVLLMDTILRRLKNA